MLLEYWPKFLGLKGLLHDWHRYTNMSFEYEGFFDLISKIP